MTSTIPLPVLDAWAIAGVRADLVALAGRLAEDSACVHQHVATVVAAGDVAWRGRAADLFRDELDAGAMRIRAAADAIDDLADAVAVLAHEVAAS